MKFTRKQVIMSLIVLIVAGVLGYWSFWQTSFTGGLGIAILLFLAFIAGPLFVIYWLLAYYALPPIVSFFVKNKVFIPVLCLLAVLTIVPLIFKRSILYSIPPIVILLICIRAFFIIRHKNQFSKRNLVIMLIALVLFVALFGGFLFGQKQLNVNIEYTKKQAEPIITGLENYYKTNKCYPDILQELRIPIPNALVGGKFKYHADTQEGKPYFGLSFSCGVFQHYYWGSNRKEWVFMD